MAFQCFAEDGTDASVIEVGLGGRLDATNVVTPAVSVITPVSLDHTAILGDTIGEIAADKAGIIKPGMPVVVAPQFPDAKSAIRAAAAEQSAPVAWIGDAVAWEVGAVSLDGQELTIHSQRDAYHVRLPLLGDFQGLNSAVAVGAVEALTGVGYEVDRHAVVKGLATAEWPGRLEVLRRDPTVIADGAHNDHSVATLLNTLPAYAPDCRLTVVAGFSRDKRVDAMVKLLAERCDRVIATRSRHPRSMRPEEIVDVFLAHGMVPDRVAAVSNVSDALDMALDTAASDDLCLVTGSLFVVAEARETVLGIPPETYPDLLPPDLRELRP